MMRSIRHSTRRNYSSEMKLFTTWCDNKKIDCDEHSPVNLCNFLLYLVTERGYLESSASVYASAVACHWKRLHSDIDSAASSPLVTALLKGAKSRSVKSPKPKVSWDIGIVLSHIKARSAANLDLQELSRIVATLVALVTAWRPRSDLGRIPMTPMLFVDGEGFQNDWRTFESCCALILISFSAHQPKEGDCKDATLLRYCQDVELCPVDWLCRFLKKTTTRSLLGDADRLFVSTKSPFPPAREDTIGSWVAGTLAECGIHSQTHSTRSVTKSVALESGVQLAEILSAAKWSGAKTFFAHYRSASVSSLLRRSPKRTSSVFADAVLMTAKRRRTAP
jgi:hypothetical protein